MTTDETKFYCKNVWQCSTEYRAHLAFELIRTYGLYSGPPDKNGKVTRVWEPHEIVERAYALVDEWFNAAVSRGDIAELTAQSKKSRSLA